MKWLDQQCSGMVPGKYSCLLADWPRLYFILRTADRVSVKQPFFKKQQCKGVF